jgi:hypothetical protein
MNELSAGMLNRTSRGGGMNILFKRQRYKWAAMWVKVQTTNSYNGLYIHHGPVLSNKILPLQSLISNLTGDSCLLTAIRKFLST